jgi:carboxyl-terminal processing protease
MLRVDGAASLAALLLAVAGAGGCARTVPPPAPTPISATLAVEVFDSTWSRVGRTYYDSTFRGLDWDRVRDELRPLARDAGTVDSLRAILGAMLDRIGDSHFAIIPAETADALDPDSLTGGTGEPGDVGVEIRILDGSLVVSRVDEGGPADLAGIRTGWVVEGIDGRPVSGLLEVLDELGEERRLGEARLAWSAERRLAGAVGDTVRVRVRNGEGEVRAIELVPTPRGGTPVRFGNLPTQYADLDHRRIPTADGCAGLIRFNVWMTPILPAFDDAFRALRDCDGIILDIRGNPGGMAGMVMGVSGYFMDEREALGRLKTRDTELSLVSMPRRVTRAGDPMQPYAGPVAVLVDGMSMSTSEIFAGGLQGVGRARVFGDVTGGQALPALMVRLPNRDVLMYVFADFVGPDGTRIEGRGVHPDRAVPLTRQHLLDGTDAALEAALAWITEEGWRAP